MFVKAHELRAGNLIDLQPILEEFDLTHEPTSRAFEREFAYVEWVSIEDDGENILIVNNQWNVTVPATFEVEVIPVA